MAYNPLRYVPLSNLSTLENESRIRTAVGILAAFCFSGLDDVFRLTAENAPLYGVSIVSIDLETRLLDIINSVVATALKKTIVAMPERSGESALELFSKLNGPLRLNLPSFNIDDVKLDPIRKSHYNNIGYGPILRILTELQPGELLLIVWENAEEATRQPIYILLNHKELKERWCQFFTKTYPNNPNPLKPVRRVVVAGPKTIPRHLKRCNWCGQNATVVRLSLCGGCKVVRYCGAEHQKMDWVGIGRDYAHRMQCKQLRRLTRQNAEWFEAPE